MILARSCCWVALLACSASAATAAPRHRIDLPGGRLGDAVVALGRQTRTSIGVTDPALASQTVSPLRGNFTMEEALRRLLRGRGARYVLFGSAAARIVPDVPVRRTDPVRPRVTTAAPAEPPRPRRRVYAAPAPEPDRTEIIVTAARRPQPLRSYAGSIVIFEGDDPALTGVRGTEALISRTPHLSSTHLGPGRNKLFIRGIADSSFNGPTQATAGQYLGETRLNYSAPDPDLRLFDVDRVEILAGPQGTLYGAGSLGGIVRVVPTPPVLDRLEGAISLGGSVTEHGKPGADAAAVLNAPLVHDRLGIRLSGYAASEGGYIDDTGRRAVDVNRVTVAGGRVSARAQPNEAWSIDLGATGQRILGRDAQYAERNLPRLTRSSALRQNFLNEYLLGSAVAARQWDDLRFVGSVGVADQRREERYDATRAGNPPAAYDLTTDGNFLSAEARLSQQGVDGAGWVIGASLLRNRSDQSREVERFERTTLRNRVINNAVEGAIYAEGAMLIARGVTASLGGRLSTTRLRSSGFAVLPGSKLPDNMVTAARTETKFLPAASISARVARDFLLYARQQRSFRPGGIAISGEDFNRFRSDKLTSLEAGGRLGQAGKGPINAALAFAYTRWSNIQADSINGFGEPATGNAGDGRIYSVDLQLGWRPVSGLEVDAAVVFNDSAFTEIAPGQSTMESPPLPGVARFNGRFAAAYRTAFPGMDVSFGAAARYTGRSNLGVGDFLRRSQGDWLEVSLHGALDFGGQNVTLAITNLLDTAGNRFSFGSPFTLDQRQFVTPVRPRTLRLGWEIRF